MGFAYSAPRTGPLVIALVVVAASGCTGINPLYTGPAEETNATGTDSDTSDATTGGDTDPPTTSDGTDEPTTSDGTTASSASTNDDTGTSDSESSSTTEPDGWNGWQRRRVITLKNFLDPSSPDNLPIALLLAPDDIDYGNVESDGGDLRFYDDLPDDSPGIPYEIQTWDPDAYTVIWLAMPSLGAGESRDIYMYYDNPDPGPEPSSPWGDYNHVLHFEGDFDDARADASSLVEQGMVTFQPGAITQAIASAGDLPFVRLEGLGGGSQGGYISLMIRANSPAAVQDILYLTGDGGEYAKLILSSSKLSFRMSSEAPLGYAQAQHPVPLNADVWTHVALSWEDVADKPALTLMVNGMAAVSGMDKLKEFQFNDDQVLMASGTGDEYIYNFSGAIDELRFDGGPKDPEFAAFEAAANFPDFFVEGIGVEEQY